MFEQGAKICRPLKPGFQDQYETNSQELGLRGVRFLLTLSFIGLFAFGGVGGCLRLAASLSRREFTFIHPDELSPEARLTHINLRTFNVGMMPEFICVLNGLRPTRERIREVAQALLEKEDDIVCLQELFHTEAADYLSNRLKAKFPYIITNIGPRSLGINSGLLIASKFPITQVEYWKHLQQGGIERYSNKGSVAVTIEPNPDQTILIFNTHLSSNVPASPDCSTGGKFYRESQIAQLKGQVEQSISRIERESKKSPIVILTGDYNIGPNLPFRLPLKNASGQQQLVIKPDPEWPTLKNLIDPMILDTEQQPTIYNVGYDASTGWDKTKLATWSRWPESVDHIGIPNTAKKIHPLKLLRRTLDPMYGSSDHLAVAVRLQILSIAND